MNHYQNHQNHSWTVAYGSEPTFWLMALDNYCSTTDETFRKSEEFLSLEEKEDQKLFFDLNSDTANDQNIERAVFHRGDPRLSIPLPIDAQTARCVLELLSIHNGKRREIRGFICGAHTAPLTLNCLCVKNAIFQNTHWQKHNAKRCIYPRMPNKYNLTWNKHTLEGAFISVAPTHFALGAWSSKRPTNVSENHFPQVKAHRFLALRGASDKLPTERSTQVNFSKFSWPSFRLQPF